MLMEDAQRSFGHEWLRGKWCDRLKFGSGSGGRTQVNDVAWSEVRAGAPQRFLAAVGTSNDMPITAVSFQYFTASLAQGRRWQSRLNQETATA